MSATLSPTAAVSESAVKQRNWKKRCASFVALAVFATSASAQQPAKPATPNQARTTLATEQGASVRRLPQHLLQDQLSFWSSPRKFRTRDFSWVAPLALVTTVTIASDLRVERELPTSTSLISRSHSLSNYAAVGYAAGVAGFYGLGLVRHDAHLQETGLLAGEAATGSLIAAEGLKYVFARERPGSGSGRGEFVSGGNSFPSIHSAAAWSIASVVAHEYPGPFTQFLAYGGAMGISAARVVGRDHFASDVLVGAAIGWYMGRQVYRARHSTDLAGDNWGSFVQADDGADQRRANRMATAYVPLDSWIYPAMDRLAALGYIDSAFQGLRPWTRMECSRMIDEAAENLDSDSNPEALRLFAALKSEFNRERSASDSGLNRGIGIDSVYSRVQGISGTPLNDGFHFGQTIANDYARPYGEGVNAIAGVSGSAVAGPFAFYVRAEGQHGAAPAPDSASVRQLISLVDGDPLVPGRPARATNRLRLVEGYVAANFASNFQISFGNQSLWWGPGEGGSLLYSNNSEPMTMVRLSQVSPATLPWVLRYLGPVRNEFFFGKPSGHLHPADVYMYGQKFSMKPTPNLELGFSRTAVMGGTGHKTTLGTFAKSFTSIGDNLSTIPGSNADVGDRRGGFDFSYRVPKLRRWLILYADSMVDDDPSPLAAPRRAAISPGIYLPRLPKLPHLDLRAEAVYTDVTSGRSYGGHYFYWNTYYHDSYLNAGNLIGSWVGREGQGIQAWSTYSFSPQTFLQMAFRHSTVGKDFIPGNYTDVSSRAEIRISPELAVSAFAQVERWNFAALAPTPKHDVTASIAFTWYPKRKQ